MEEERFVVKKGYLRDGAKKTVQYYVWDTKEKKNLIGHHKKSDAEEAAKYANNRIRLAQI